MESRTAAESLSLVIPQSGEVVSFDDPDSCLRALAEIRDLERRLREAKVQLTEALAFEFSRQGTKTMEVGEIKAELKGGSEIVWDVEVLNELRGLGLPEERMDALITTEVSFRVNANEAKRIAAANPSYASVVERARKSVPKALYVAIKPGGTTGGTNLDARHGVGRHDLGRDEPPSQTSSERDDQRADDDHGGGVR